MTGEADIQTCTPTHDRWRELDQTLRPFIARRVRSEADVDDVLQDTFLKMQRGLSSLRDEDRFGPWVYRVARSAIADHQRTSARHPLVFERPGHAASDTSDETGPSSSGNPEAPNSDPSIGDPDEVCASELLARVLPPFVAMLPSPYREALTLVELEGLTQREAADMLGVSLSGMKSRVQRGRALLRKTLEDCCHIALDARGKPVSCELRADGRLPSGCCE